MSQNDTGEIRSAAEFLVNNARRNVGNVGGYYNRSLPPYNIPPRHSINLISEDFLGGYMQDGRMSVVRRFFCLFVTFDLIFVSLLWIICIMINGDNVVNAFQEQILNYSLYTSLFDVVAAALCRFLILIFFYAILYINHWSVITVTTSSSCLFLISKVFLFDWVDSKQQVFEVILIITSFVLAWGEAWFLDCRVIPQERYANHYYRALLTSDQAPLLTSYVPAPNQRMQQESSPHTHYYSPFLGTEFGPPAPDSVANFYSPLDSIHHSDEEDEQVLIVNEKKEELSDLEENFEKLFTSNETIEVLSVLEEKDEQVLTSNDDLILPSYKENESESSLDEEEEVHYSIISDELKDDELLQMGLSSVHKAYELFESNGWKIEKVTPKGDTIYSTQRDNIGKIFKITGLIKYSAKTLSEELFYKIEDVTKWNPAILESKVVHKVNSYVDVTYQASASGGGGIIKSRDFVNLRCFRLFRNGKICENLTSSACNSGDDTAGTGSVSTVSGDDKIQRRPSSGGSRVSRQSRASSIGPTSYDTLSKSLGAKGFGGAKSTPGIHFEEPPPLDEQLTDDRKSVEDVSQKSEKTPLLPGMTKDKVWISSAISIDYLTVPPTTKYVRGENKVAAFAFREIVGKPNTCIFEWLLCLDLKGYIPRYILDTAYTTFMADYMTYLRKYVKEMRRQRKRVVPTE